LRADLPGIEDSHAEALEILHVARDDGEVVDDRGGGDQGVQAEIGPADDA
jgi:hypothetical protein